MHKKARVKVWLSLVCILFSTSIDRAKRLSTEENIAGSVQMYLVCFHVRFSRYPGPFDSLENREVTLCLWNTNGGHFALQRTTTEVVVVHGTGCVSRDWLCK